MIKHVSLEVLYRRLKLVKTISNSHFNNWMFQIIHTCITVAIGQKVFENIVYRAVITLFLKKDGIQTITISEYMFQFPLILAKCFWIISVQQFAIENLKER